MKVLMLSSDRNVLASGSAVAERMKEYGALVEELHVVLLSDKSHGLKDTQLDKNIWVYPTNSSRNFFRPLDAARIGKKLIREKKFVRGLSVITADSIECGWAGAKIKSKWRIPLEVQIHNDPFSPHYTGFQNRVRKFYSKKVFKSADSIRVVTEGLKGKITSLTNAEVNVLPIYIDKRRIEEGRVAFDLRARYGFNFTILMVCRLTAEKNLPFALEILARLREIYPDTGLVIVGSGPMESGLKRRAEKLGLERNVVFAGWQNDLVSYYKTANVFLQTSDFEGYGMALVEAGLSGLPVISTPVGVATELTHGEDAYIYPSGETELFVAGLKELIENNTRRERLKISLRNTLESKLLVKDEYLKRMLSNWEGISKKVK
jgi:glycosyltransferase involved in cell wall biosynthesis